MSRDREPVLYGPSGSHQEAPYFVLDGDTCFIKFDEPIIKNRVVYRPFNINYSLRGQAEKEGFLTGIRIEIPPSKSNYVIRVTHPEVKTIEASTSGDGWFVGLTQDNQVIKLRADHFSPDIVYPEQTWYGCWVAAPDSPLAVIRVFQRQQADPRFLGFNELTHVSSIPPTLKTEINKLLNLNL